MFSSATRVLRLAFEPTATANSVPTDDSRIDVVAYGAECVFTGSLLLNAARLTDLLNNADVVDLVDVVCLGLSGELIEADSALVKRTELLAVKAGNPRGSKSLRHGTRQIAVTAGAGPYLIHGYLHARPGADPMIHLGRRLSMVPLTDATIAYPTARGWQRDEASTVILNRDVADYIAPAREHDLARIWRLGAA